MRTGTAGPTRSDAADFVVLGPVGARLFQPRLNGVVRRARGSRTRGSGRGGAEVVAAGSAFLFAPPLAAPDPTDEGEDWEHERDDGKQPMRDEQRPAARLVVPVVVPQPRHAKIVAEVDRVVERPAQLP